MLWSIVPLGPARGIIQAGPGISTLPLFILPPGTSSCVPLLHTLLLCHSQCKSGRPAKLSQSPQSPLADRRQLTCTPNTVAEWGHRAPPLPGQVPCPLILPVTGHLGDLGLEQRPLTCLLCLSDVTEAICLSDPWMLQALHGSQLPPQAREGALSQGAADP